MQLQVETWPIEKLVPYARNPRKNDEQVSRMVSAIREFGFRIPIIAKSDGTVIDGHLRLKAAQQLGLKEVPVALADELTKAQEKAFRLLALNKHEAPVSRIFSIAVKMLRKNFSGLKMIVSYADPEQGHHGGIYQATNWIYLGPTKSSFSWSINGKLVHKRTADSLAKKSGLATGDFLAAKFGGAHKVQTQPKHKYIYPLTDELRATYKPKAMPYPKRVNASEAGNGGDQPHSGSATLTQTLHQFGEVANG